MITALAQLPALSRSWLGALEKTDRALFDELAASLVIVAPGQAGGEEFPLDIGIVLEELDLRGREIGAFRFAPLAEGETGAQHIAAYDAGMRDNFEAPVEVVFIGQYGAGDLIAAADGIGISDPDTGEVHMVAQDFATFLLVQANAYDAYKAHIVKARDEAAYHQRRHDVATHFTTADVVAVFAAQLRA